MSESAPQKRNNYLDIVKGIAIIMVVIGHNIQYGSLYSINDYFWDNALFRFIYSFHMTLFSLVSGYLFYFSSNKYSCVSMVKNRFIRVLVPLFVWETIYIIMQNVISVIKNGSLASIGPSQYVYSYWFLWAIFWCSIIVLIIRELVKDSFNAYCIVFILSLFIPKILNSHLYVYVFPYFVSGYLWNKYSFNNKIAELKITSLIGISIALIFLYNMLFFNFNNDYYIYKSGTSIITHSGIDFNQLYVDFYRYIIGGVGSISMLLILWLFKTKKIIKDSCIYLLIANIGKKSLGIYIISEPFVNMIIKQLPYKQYLGIIAVIFETVFVLAITCCIINLMERKRICSMFFFGGR